MYMCNECHCCHVELDEQNAQMLLLILILILICFRIPILNLILNVPYGHLAVTVVIMVPHCIE